jgi:hypothetical protein
LEIEAREPCAEEINTAGVETSLKCAKDGSKNSHNIPTGHKAKTLTPCQRKKCIQIAILTIITAPHAITMADRNIRGPTFRITTTAGAWKIVYVMKKTRETMV